MGSSFSSGCGVLGRRVECWNQRERTRTKYTRQEPHWMTVIREDLKVRS
jgi:hypothetical protein